MEKWPEKVTKCENSGRLRKKYLKGSLKGRILLKKWNKRKEGRDSEIVQSVKDPTGLGEQ